MRFNIHAAPLVNIITISVDQYAYDWQQTSVSNVMDFDGASFSLSVMASNIASDFSPCRGRTEVKQFDATGRTLFQLTSMKYNFQLSVDQFDNLPSDVFEPKVSIGQLFHTCDTDSMSGKPILGLIWDGSASMDSPSFIVLVNTSCVSGNSTLYDLTSAN